MSSIFPGSEGEPGSLGSAAIWPKVVIHGLWPRRDRG